MKVFCFSDFHAGGGGALDARVAHLAPRIKTATPDVVIVAGDWSDFGRAGKAFYRAVRKGAGNRPILFVEGNHESEGPILDFEEIGAIQIARRAKLIGEVIFFGVPFVWEHQSDSPAVRKIGEEVMKQVEALGAGPRVMVSHMPPTSYFPRSPDNLREGGDEEGSSFVDSLMRRSRPRFLVTGHHHVPRPVRITRCGVTIINPGPDGDVFELPDA